MFLFSFATSLGLMLIYCMYKLSVLKLIMVGGIHCTELGIIFPHISWNTVWIHAS